VPFSRCTSFIILIVVLIVFGPGERSELSGQLGEGVREFRQLSEGATGVPSGDRHFTQCGVAVLAGAAFCTSCGNRLGRESDG